MSQKPIIKFISPGKGVRGVRPVGYLLSAGILVMGCAGHQAAPVTLPEPIEPVIHGLGGSFNPLTIWDECSGLGKNTVPGKDDVVELVLTYSQAGRDWDEREGPRDLVLRVVPLDRNKRPQAMQADVSIILFENPTAEKNSAAAQPVLVWEVSSRSLESYWTPTKLMDSYLFRLNWGETPPVSDNYLLLVRFDPLRANEPVVCQSIMLGLL